MIVFDIFILFNVVVGFHHYHWGKYLTRDGLTRSMGYPDHGFRHFQGDFLNQWNLLPNHWINRLYDNANQKPLVGK